MKTATLGPFTQEARDLYPLLISFNFPICPVSCPQRSAPTRVSTTPRPKTKESLITATLCTAKLATNSGLASKKRRPEKVPRICGREPQKEMPNRRTTPVSPMHRLADSKIEVGFFVKIDEDR